MNCAEATAAQVDEEVRQLMADAYQDAIRILEENREMLDKIASYLLEKETITGQEMMAILEGRDPALVDNYGATPEPRRRTLGGDVEPPARAIHMISEAPVNPFADPSQETQEENLNPDTPEDSISDTATEESSADSPETAPDLDASGSDDSADETESEEKPQ